VCVCVCVCGVMYFRCFRYSLLISCYQADSRLQKPEQFIRVLASIPQATTRLNCCKFRSVAHIFELSDRTLVDTSLSITCECSSHHDCMVLRFDVRNRFDAQREEVLKGIQALLEVS